MSKGLGKTQKWILQTAQYLRGDVYRKVVYELGQKEGYHKASVARGIRSLVDRGLVALQGEGQFTRLVLSEKAILENAWY